MKRTVDILVLIAVLTCVFMSGGLMWHQCIIPLFCLGLAFLFAKRKTNELGLIISVCIIFAYGISLFNTSGNFQNSLYEGEKFLLFLLALVLGTCTNKKTIQYAVYAPAFLIAFVGLAAYCGFSNISDFVINSNGVVRLQSLLRYANTTACILGCGYIIAISLYSETPKKLHLYLSSLILLAMILTVSKAAIPIFICVGTLLVFKKRDIAFRFLFQFLITAVFLLPLMFFAKKSLYFPMAVLIVICVLISATTISFLSNITALKIWTIALVLGLLAGVSLIVLKPSFFSTLTQRFVYMKDALKLVPQKFFFGWGVGSWRVLQYAIQSTQYDVNYIHNGFLQFLFENGIVFTIGFAVLSIYSFYGALKKENYDFAVVILFIIIHSLIDFDLSFGIVLIIFGLVVGSSITFEFKKQKSIVASILSVIIFAVFFSSLSYMTIEYVSRSKFESLCLENRYEEAILQAEKLEYICPKDSSLKMNVAALCEKTQKDTTEIKGKIEEARALSPYDPEVFKGYMVYNITHDNIEKLCKKYISMKPKHEKTYVEVKKMVENAYEFQIIDESIKNNTIKTIDEIRVKNKVYDRNELLDRLIKERGNKK